MRKFIDLDVEMAVLNMILSAGDLLPTPDALTYLQRELRGVPVDLLGDPTHQRIDGAARALLTRGRLPLVADLRLQPDLRDVPDAVWAAIDAATPGAQLGVHVERLTALAADRRLERTLRRSLAHLQASGDAAAVLDELQAELAATRTGTPPPLRGVNEFASILDYAEARRDGQLTGLTTGIRSVDERLGGGLLPGKLILFGSPSGTGKSRFAFGMTAANLLAGRHVLYVSGEMKEVALGDAKPAHEVIVGVAGVLAGLPRIGAGATIKPTTRTRLEEVQSWLSERQGLHVYDGTMDLTRIKDLIWDAQRRGVDLIVIDNLTHVLMGTTLPVRADNEPSIKPRRVLDALSSVADEAGVALLVLFQPSVTNNTARGQAPREDELGESRGIVHSAYAVLTGGRPAQPPRSGTHTDAEINVLKIRGNGGQRGSVPVRWNERLGVWCDDASPDGPVLEQP